MSANVAIHGGEPVLHSGQSSPWLLSPPPPKPAPTALSTAASSADESTASCTEASTSFAVISSSAIFSLTYYLRLGAQCSGLGGDESLTLFRWDEGDQKVCQDTCVAALLDKQDSLDDKRTVCRFNFRTIGQLL